MVFKMSSYEYFNGCEKRKWKSDRDKVAKEMKRSLHKFLIRNGEQIQ